jgi:hypothetical protein
VANRACYTDLDTSSDRCAITNFGELSVPVCILHPRNYDARKDGG